VRNFASCSTSLIVQGGQILKAQ